MPEAGHVWTGHDPKFVVDEAAAAVVERIIVMMGLVHFDAQQTLISAYCHRRSYEEIARMRDWKVGHVKMMIADGEQLYHDMRAQGRAA